MTRQGQRNGWKAEAFVAKILEDSHDLVIPLAPAWSADIATMLKVPNMRTGRDDIVVTFWEVKSSRNANRALKAKLSDAEVAFAERCAAEGYGFNVVRIQTFPDGSCQWLKPAKKELLPPQSPLSISPSGQRTLDSP